MSPGERATPAPADLEAAAARFRREVSRGRHADAYLILGPSRPRLRRLALALAEAHLQSPGPVEGHPDCVILEPEEGGRLRVEDIAERESRRQAAGGEEASPGAKPCLERSLRCRPLGGGRRAVLLYEADRMLPEAQTALLKTAEEPPPGTVLFLTAVDPSPLLPALRSRCRTFRLAATPPEEVALLAAERGIPQNEWEILAPALGTPEAALDLDKDTRDDLVRRHRAFSDWLDGGPLSWLDPPEGADLGEKRQRGQRILAAVLGWLRQAYPSAGPRLARRLDQAAAHLWTALGDLAGNVTPAVVFEDLACILDRPGGDSQAGAPR